MQQELPSGFSQNDPSCSSFLPQQCKTQKKKWKKVGDN